MAGDDHNGRLAGRLAELRWALRLSALPPRVAWFHWRARRLASRTGDVFSLTSATRSADLRVLLGLARGRRRVVELGTATGWTAISLALADRSREVVTYDIVARDEPGRYLGLVDLQTRGRIERVIAPGISGPRDRRPVDLLYIDSSHERAETIAEVLAWRTVLRPGSLIVFDDFTHPDFPGVREAVAELALEGEKRGTLYIHRVGPGQGQ
jgi:predicted O-methyltransferase YrrM